MIIAQPHVNVNYVFSQNYHPQTLEIWQTLLLLIYTHLSKISGFVFWQISVTATINFVQKYCIYTEIKNFWPLSLKNKGFQFTDIFC